MYQISRLGKFNAIRRKNQEETIIDFGATANHSSIKKSRQITFYAAVKILTAFLRYSPIKKTLPMFRKK